mmetsp:Transcript_13634/g.20444  ORF Transcript_13634/g.20444 Transcript_13634/m.20444 type:complete len:144 (-) Transcript_13634:189-620(-)|eukprot:CAMPEP_0170108422 /NCGR_PEP_ID=MMETSP0020_2-20130122/6564_1 /TAXON_ID=98059 /ORGANISM="Dinobryon sp., Strain UTEXLB2267" /LENGTH=143 /DNA_ID=CAMNT_0010333145 /DNA_START=20 /DNA_END=451 /DNA_ORIENTATION=+
MALNSRYLDVMTVRPSQAASSADVKNPHSSLLIEPILMPNLQHIELESSQEFRQNCLFYPNGSKNKQMRKEIESTTKKYESISSGINREVKPDKYRVVKKDKYANVKGPPLFYTKKSDPETIELIKSVKINEIKIAGTVQLKL